MAFDAGECRPGHVAGARIETGRRYVMFGELLGRPGHVAGARIETCLDRMRPNRRYRRPGHVAGARIETRDIARKWL